MSLAVKGQGRRVEGRPRSGLTVDLRPGRLPSTQGSGCLVRELLPLFPPKLGARARAHTHTHVSLNPLQVDYTGSHGRKERTSESVGGALVWPQRINKHRGWLWNWPPGKLSGSAPSSSLSFKDFSIPLTCPLDKGVNYPQIRFPFLSPLWIFSSQFWGRALAES